MGRGRDCRGDSGSSEDRLMGRGWGCRGDSGSSEEC